VVPPSDSRSAPPRGNEPRESPCLEAPRGNTWEFPQKSCPEQNLPIGTMLNVEDSSKSHSAMEQGVMSGNDQSIWSFIGKAPETDPFTRGPPSKFPKPIHFWMGSLGWYPHGWTEVQSPKRPDTRKFGVEHGEYRVENPSLGVGQQPESG
jgi:hypothetical protein